MVSPDDAHVVPELDEGEDVAPERYQRSISRLTFCFDQRPSVLQDRTLVGRISGSPQHVEMLMWGSVMGQEAAVAIERQQQQDRVDVSLIEYFAEKLVEIGADCGVLYSTSGFTSQAQDGAAAMRRPAVMLISLGRPGTADRPRIPAQRCAQENKEFRRPHHAEEVTKMDFLLYLWLRPEKLD